MHTLRFFETILTVLLLLLLGYVFETRIKAGWLVGGLAVLRLGRLALAVNVYRPKRAFIRLALV